jgi:mannose-6-phosphate isomerase-like protein (cupin superfamily)
MGVKKIDVVKEPELDLGHSKKVLFTSEHFHTWIHGDYPGTKGPMHKHTADQFFYCAQGECTFHFPDGTKDFIRPGQMMLVPAGNFYQLDNTGDEYLILIGARAESAGKPRHGTKGEKVGDNDFAIRHRDKIKVPAGKGGA